MCANNSQCVRAKRGISRNSHDLCKITSTLNFLEAGAKEANKGVDDFIHEKADEYEAIQAEKVKNKTGKKRKSPPVDFQVHSKLNVKADTLAQKNKEQAKQIASLEAKLEKALKTTSSDGKSMEQMEEIRAHYVARCGRLQFTISAMNIRMAELDSAYKQVCGRLLEEKPNYNIPVIPSMDDCRAKQTECKSLKPACIMFFLTCLLCCSQPSFGMQCPSDSCSSSRLSIPPQWWKPAPPRLNLPRKEHNLPIRLPRFLLTRHPSMSACFLQMLL